MHASCIEMGAMLECPNKKKKGRRLACLRLQLQKADYCGCLTSCLCVQTANEDAARMLKPTSSSSASSSSSAPPKAAMPPMPILAQAKVISFPFTSS